MPITTNIEEFIEMIRKTAEGLPEQHELCDLGNIVGISLAKVTGSNDEIEREFIQGVEHGLDLFKNNPRLHPKQ